MMAMLRMEDKTSPLWVLLPIYYVQWNRAGRDQAVNGGVGQGSFGEGGTLVHVCAEAPGSQQEEKPSQAKGCAHDGGRISILETYETDADQPAASQDYW